MEGERRGWRERVAWGLAYRDWRSSEGRLLEGVVVRRGSRGGIAFGGLLADWRRARTGDGAGGVPMKVAVTKETGVIRDCGAGVACGAAAAASGHGGGVVLVIFVYIDDQGPGAGGAYRRLLACARLTLRGGGGHGCGRDLKRAGCVLARCIQAGKKNIQWFDAVGLVGQMCQKNHGKFQ